MIQYKKGDIFKSRANVLVNPVNCDGVMGAGLAREFKKRFPANYATYKIRCNRYNPPVPGDIIVGFPHRKENPYTVILNVCTKGKWKDPSTYDIINRCCISLRDYIIDHTITSIDIPALGCGNGGLEWEKVKSIMELHLHDLPMDIEIYEPFN